jgi:DNA-binding XRE family transcriptional regulator
MRAAEVGAGQAHAIEGSVVEVRLAVLVHLGPAAVLLSGTDHESAALEVLGATWQRPRTRFGERVPGLWPFWSPISGGQGLGTNGYLVRLAAVREAAGLNKKELAQRAGLSRETVSRIETLKRPAEPATVRALAAALEVEPVVLVTL